MGLKQDQIKLVELDTRDDGEAIQDALLELTGGRSVPRVFIDGQFIGGGDDTDVRRVGSIGWDWQCGVIVIQGISVRSWCWCGWWTGLLLIVSSDQALNATKSPFLQSLARSGKLAAMLKEKGIL